MSLYIKLININKNEKINNHFIENKKIKIYMIDYLNFSEIIYIFNFGFFALHQ